MAGHCPLSSTRKAFNLNFNHNVMQTLIIIAVSITLILMAFFMAWAINLYQAVSFRDRKRANDMLHKFGWLSRVAAAIIPVVSGLYMKLTVDVILYQFLILTFIAWAPWDLIINWINGNKWHYSGSIDSGTSSRIDKLLNKVDEWIKAAMLLLIILWYPVGVDTLIQERGWSLLIAIGIFGVFGYGAYRFYHKKSR